MNATSDACESTESFADRLASACREKNSVVCMGLDPRPEMLPAEFGAGSGDADRDATAFVAWACEVVDAAADLVPIVKPQSAFFEALGSAGYAALEATIAHARSLGVLVLLDAKRGDIGSTAEAYARAHLDRMGADAMTVNPYLGRDTLEPFLERCRENGKGIFVLVKTSNPGSADLQDRELADGPVHEHVARAVAEIGSGEGLTGQGGRSSVGAVVGATYPRELGRLRALMPATPILVPGYGAQGAGAAECAPAFAGDGLGAIVNSSRGLTFAFRKGAHAEEYGEARWRDSVRAAVTEMGDALNAVRESAGA